MSALNLFHQSTIDWFQSALGKPTAIQESAWPAIACKNHTLVSAPTGTGKTLSAFLVFIDQLREQGRQGTLKEELQVIYVSPLKSLAGDIRQNLRRPLEGISALEGARKVDAVREAEGVSEMGDAGELEGARTGQDVCEINVAIRTGDTTQSERRKMIKHPPHILITTPESLYLMITSKSGKTILQTAKVLIIDELHALIDTKRGAHLMLTAARLDKLCREPLQRIGLSATINPLDTASKYLSPEQVTIAVPKMKKKIQIEVLSPLTEARVKMNDNIWLKLAKTVYARSRKARSVIVFVEGRMYAEKLAHYINQAAGEGYARTHHGSLSKERRLEVEQALREGSLRILCTTSSMELGIDVGDVDQVFQVGCPRSISSTMQRLGRAGHNPDRTSVMYMFPRTASEGLYCGLTAEAARSGSLEDSKPPRLCLDILAQHLVSMAVDETYTLKEVMEILARAYPFCQVTIDDVRKVLCMLAGDFEHDRDIPVRPRVLYDRIHEVVEGDAYSRLLAISAGGTIPDKGMYTAKTEEGIKLGELDEEFVYESRIGDRFLLGTFAWQIVKQEKDNVIVRQTSTEGAKLPFWKGELKGRGIKTGILFGRIFHSLTEAHAGGYLMEELTKLGLDEAAAQNAADFIKRQIQVTGVLPDDRTIIMEHYVNAAGDYQIAVHSVFGRQINTPLSLLVQEAARRLTDCDIGCVDEESGFLIYSHGENKLPKGLLGGIDPDKGRALLEAMLPMTPLFTMTFRYNSARALMMGSKTKGRNPLWLQRLRSSQMLESVIEYEDHPLIRETKRECLEDLWDLNGVEEVLKGIQTGSIQIREIYVENLSPMSLPMQWQVEAVNMYDYTPVAPGTQKAAKDALEKVPMMKAGKKQLEQVSLRSRLPEDEKQLHSLLMIEGDLLGGELDLPVEWLESLVEKERVCYIEPGLWIAEEHAKEYETALCGAMNEQINVKINKGNNKKVNERNNKKKYEKNNQDTDENLIIQARSRIVRRALRYRGAQTLEQIQSRYLWSENDTSKVLQQLCRQENAICLNGIYYHAQLYKRAQHETVKNLRRQIKTLPAERYAALLINRIALTAPAQEQLSNALNQLSNVIYPLSIWESILLPGRVDRYRGELLDKLLSQGDFFWQYNAQAGLSFHRYEDIDWDADLIHDPTDMDEEEKKVMETLIKRGASFIQMISKIEGVTSVYDTLLCLAKKGLVYSDSFAPLRQILGKEKLAKKSVKQRIHVRTKSMTSGRWDIVRPLKAETIEQQLEAQFNRVVILSRETAGSLNWSTLLETLRVWEYTGRVRRGYFIEGMSGIQFIRDQEFSKTLLSLEQPDQDISWISAIDPVQPWGKSLSHMEGRSFLNVAGTAVCLLAGTPIAVFEKKGKTLRIFEETDVTKALQAFINAFEKRRIYGEMNRLIVKDYPAEAISELSKAGFCKEMQDYVLYRKL